MADILVVEDNPQNRKLVRTLLELEGHQSIEATSASEARQRLAEGMPGMVLLDIQLPGEDGVTLLRSLRRDPATADLVVIAMTAYAMRGDRERLLHEGFDGYMSKPIDIQAFSDLLMKHVGAT